MASTLSRSSEAFSRLKKFSVWVSFRSLEGTSSSGSEGWILPRSSASSIALLVMLGWLICVYVESFRWLWKPPSALATQIHDPKIKVSTFFRHGDGDNEDGHRVCRRIAGDLPHGGRQLSVFYRHVHLGIPLSRWMIVESRWDQEPDDASNTRV